MRSWKYATPSLQYSTRPSTDTTITAAAAKVLKDLHEQKQIEGRPAGKLPSYSHLTIH